MPKGQPPGPNFAIEGSPARPLSILQDAVTGERYRVRIHSEGKSGPQVTVEKAQEAPLVPVDVALAEAPYLLNSGTQALSDSKTECDPGLNQLVFEAFNTNHDPEGTLDAGTINVVLNGVPDNAWQDGVSTTDNLSKCLVQYLPVGATEWQTATQGTYPPDPTWPQWSIPLSADNPLPHFDPDQSAQKLQIKLCNLHTDLVSGLTGAVASLEFTDCRDAAGNDYGETWFNLQLIKSPLVTKGAHVGVGNLQALAPLHVGVATKSTEFPATPPLLISQDINNATHWHPHLVLHNESSEEGAGGVLAFTGRGKAPDSDNYIGAAIFGELEHQEKGVAGSLVFRTGTTQPESVGVDPRMTILPNGNVGIVTQTPQAPLQVGTETGADWAEVDAGTVLINRNNASQGDHPHLRLHNKGGGGIAYTSLSFSSTPESSNKPLLGAALRCTLDKREDTVNGQLDLVTSTNGVLTNRLSISTVGDITLQGPVLINDTLHVSKTTEIRGELAASGGLNAKGTINLGLNSSNILSMIVGFPGGNDSGQEWKSTVGTDTDDNDCHIVQFKNAEPWNQDGVRALVVATPLFLDGSYNTFSQATFSTRPPDGDPSYSDYGFYLYEKNEDGDLTTSQGFSFIAICFAN